MQYRSDTKKVKGLGTAKHGFQHWWLQKITSVFLLPLSLWFFYSLTRLDSLSPDNVIMWLSQPISALLMALFVTTSIYHGAIGLQVVVEDYVHGKTAQLFLQFLLKFAMFAMLMASLFALIKLVS